MPISKQYSSIFIHIPKCAGTTIEKLLNMSTKECFYEKKINSPQHFSWQELKEKISFDYSNYFKFSIIRNPYDRIISEYKWRNKNIGALKFNYDRYFTDINTYIENIEYFMYDFNMDRHLYSQSFFLKDKDDKISKDIEIFDFKNLEPLWQKIEDITKIPRSLFPKANNTDSFFLTKNHISEENIKKIQKIYQEDFDNFKF